MLIEKLGQKVELCFRILKLFLLLSVMHIMYLQYVPPSSPSTEICEIDHNIKTHIINYINFTNGTNYLYRYILFAIILLLEHIKCQFVLFAGQQTHFLWNVIALEYKMSRWWSYIHMTQIKLIWPRSLQLFNPSRLDWPLFSAKSD